MELVHHGDLRGALTIGVEVSLNYPQHPNPYGFGAGGDWDQVHDILNTSFVTVNGVDPKYFFSGEGYYSPPTFKIQNRGRKPEPRDYDPLADIKKFSNPLGFLVSGRGRASPPDWERQVGHFSMSGSVVDIGATLYSYDDGRSTKVWDLDIPIPDQALADNIYTFPIYETVWGSPPNPGHDFSLWTWANKTAPLNTVLDLLDGLENNASPFPYLGFFSDIPIPLQKCYGHVSGDGSKFGVFDVKKTSSTSLSYKAFLIRGIYARLTVHEINFDLQFRGLISPGTAIGIDIFSLVGSRSVEVTYFVKTPLPVSKYGNWLAITDPERYNWAAPLNSNCFPFTGAVGYFNRDIPNILTEGKSVYVENTYDLLSKNLGLYRPAVMMSFADAMSNYRVMASNYIEVIYEAEELLHLAPDLKGLLAAFTALKAYKDFRSGGVVDGALGIGDFFSSSYLLASFGWRPLAQNASEITSKIDHVGENLRNLKSPKTLHGKFRFNIPETLGIKDVRLVARSKIRLRGISDDFIINSLKLDSLGLLPRSSNIWDLIPWSWFVDYFTGLATRYDVIDASLLACALDHEYCVHSISLESPIPKEVLLRDGLQGLPGDPPKFKAYFRESSVVIPFIFDSDIDFGAPVVGPDKGILFSLVWQLARQFFAP
jgi:hypothetical protein